jgi:hypothetical protein
VANPLNKETCPQCSALLDTPDRIELEQLQEEVEALRRQLALARKLLKLFASPRDVLVEN